LIYVWDGAIWNLASGGGGGGDAFTIIQTDTGTSPVADNATDTLTMTTDDLGSYRFNGNATTDTVDLRIDDATGSKRGLVNTTTQTIAGEKTFSTGVKSPHVDATSSAGLSLRNQGGTSQILVGAGGGNNITLQTPTVVSDHMIGNATDYWKMPTGTTAQRPGTPSDGMFRYNSTDDKVEFREAGSWINIGSGGSSTFTALTDTPAAYTGDAFKVARVNNTESGLVFSSVNDLIGYTPADSARNVSTTNGITGGGNLTADRTLSLDINGLTSVSVSRSADQIPIFSSVASANRKINRDDFFSGRKFYPNKSFESLCHFTQTAASGEALIGTAPTFTFLNEFSLRNAATASIATHFSDPKAIGAAQFETGTTTNGRCTLLAGGLTITNSNPLFTIESAIKINSSPSSGQNTEYFIGAVSTYTGRGHGFWLLSDFDVNGGNWTLYSVNSNTTTTFNTGWTPNVGSGSDYQTLRVWLLGGEVRCSLDGVEPSGTGYPITTNIPDDSSEIRGGVRVRKLAGSTNRIAFLDYVYVYKDF